MMDYTKVLPLLQTAINHKATDIHLVVGKPPIYRIHGVLIKSELPVLKLEDIQNLLFNMMTEAQRQTFAKLQDIDLSFIGVKDFNFRVNAHVEKGRPAANIRILPTIIPSAKDLGLPAIVEKLALKRKGFIIISGPSGSGKTTTMNYMVDLINKERPFKIVMIEDPSNTFMNPKKALSSSAK